MASKWLARLGVLLLILGIIGFAAVYMDLRDKRAKAADAAKAMGLPEMADPVNVTDLVKFDRMDDSTQALAYAALAASAGGLVCLVGALVLRPSRPNTVG